MVFQRLSPVNRRSIHNPFAARSDIEQMVARSPMAKWPDYQSALSQCSELDHKLNTLPHSLFHHLYNAVELALPGSGKRAGRLLGVVSRSYGALLSDSLFADKTAQLKQLVWQALHRAK
jgi:hypothetical protein